MAVSLAKNTKVSLAKEHPALKRLRLGLSWDIPVMAGQTKADLDVSLFCLNDIDGKIQYERDFVFYGSNDRRESHLQHPSGAIIHSGDEREGAKDGYDETIDIDLERVPDYIKEMVNVTTIHTDHTFQNVRKARVDLINIDTNEVLYTYDLSEDGGNLKALTVCRVYRHTDGWRFEPIGAGYPGGLLEYCQRYGVEVK